MGGQASRSAPARRKEQAQSGCVAGRSDVPKDLRADGRNCLAELRNFSNHSRLQVQEKVITALLSQKSKLASNEARYLSLLKMLVGLLMVQFCISHSSEHSWLSRSPVSVTDTQGKNQEP